MKNTNHLYTGCKAACLALLLLRGALLFPLAHGMSEQPSHPCPIKADLWVTTGQSNMASNDSTGKPVHFDPKRMMVFRFDNIWATVQEPAHAWWKSKDPVHREIFVKQRLCDSVILPEAEIRARWEQENNAPINFSEDAIGVASTFAQHIVDNTEYNIGIVPCSHGGTNILEWDPALRDKGGESLYGSMLQRIRMVGGNIKGVIWIQGMANINPDPRLGIPNISMEEYERKLVNLVDNIRRDTNNPNLPFIYVQEGRVVQQNDNPKLWLALRDAQRRAMSQRRSMYMVSAIDLPNRDWCHYNTEGIRRIGKRLAEIALSEVYAVPGHGHPICLESMILEDGHSEYPVIRLRFSGVTGRLRSKGRPADFELCRPNQSAEELGKLPWQDAPVIFRTDFDHDRPADLLLRVHGTINQLVQLVYGVGSNPYCNITDERDIPVPAFGPIDVPMPEDSDKDHKAIFYIDQYHQRK